VLGREIKFEGFENAAVFVVFRDHLAAGKH